MSITVPINNTQYVTNFICTYKLFEDGSECAADQSADQSVYDCDVMYRIQLIQACGGKNDMDEMNHILDDLYEAIHETTWCSRVMNQLMCNAPIGMEYEPMFITLFGYEMFHIFHGCICEYFHNGIVSQSRIELMCKACSAGLNQINAVDIGQKMEFDFSKP
jgi:hypothetical protein